MAVKVIKRETQKVYGLTDEQLKDLKNDLTIDNPKYISAQRFSKYKVTRIPKYLTFYDVYKDYIEIPSGYNIGELTDTFTDLRVVSTVSYPTIKIDLRDTQSEAYKNWIEDTDKGIICMATGKGKSILGTYCAYAMRQKCLVIVHKDDLVKGWQKDIDLCFGGEITTGLVKANKRIVGEQITIATIQTLNSWATKDLDSFTEFVEQFGMVIVDEMHHIAGSIYDLINHFPAYYKIGLTATPERSDGLTKVMYWYLGEMAYRYEYTVDDEDILPVNVHCLTSQAVYEPMCYEIPNSVKKDGTQSFKYVLESLVSAPEPEWDLVPAEKVPVKQRPKIAYTDVDDLVLSSKYTQNLIGDTVQSLYKQGHSVILFFKQKVHCWDYMKLAEEQWGIPPESMCVYNGDVKRTDLDRYRDEIESGKIKITFASYSIATEGTNVKAWDTAILVSSINNGKNVEQAIGRVRRTSKNKGKVANVYDIRYPNAYSLKNHCWTRDRRYKELKLKIISNENSSKPSGRRFNYSF